MKIKRFIFILFFVFNIPLLTAQNILDHQKDTLRSLIDQSNRAYEVYNYKDAIKYASILIDKSREYHDDYHSFLAYDILGGIYSETDDSVQGRIFSEKALEIARATKVDSLIAWGSLNLAILYSDNKKTYDKAIHFFKESIAINERLKDVDQLYLIYISLAWTYIDNQQFQEAHTILSKADSISEKKKIDPLNKLYIELLFGKYYHAIKDYDLAKKQLESITEEIDNDSITDLAIEVYNNLAEVYYKTDEPKNAFLSLEKYNHYKQKAYTLEKIEETEKARAKFDLKQAQNDLRTVINEKEYSDTLTAILIVATIILIIALLGFFLFFRTRRRYIDHLKNYNEELIVAKEKAEKLSKVQTKFLSTVSHELRTPLYGVIGISTLLKEDPKLKAYEEDLESLKFSADYLLALINEVLLISKMDAEAIKLSKKPYKLDSLIHSITRSFEYSLQQSNNKLHVQIDKNIPNSLIGDPVRLSQILMNLVGNALKFTKEGNVWITLNLISVSKKGSYKTRFTIKDDGPGIPIDKQEVIFHEFTQVENANHSYKGTGLGLAIVKKLLKLYNSKIHLKSAPEHGSEFNFSINLKKNDHQYEESDDETSKSADTDDTKLSGDKHILIVDDNKINQKITQKILDKYNVKSSLADDGKQAVEMSRLYKYDLILMDINMPKINGMEAAVMIREFDKNIPIIALTAVELDEMRVEITNSGINDIIHKPYDRSEFIKIIIKNIPAEKLTL
ncbi:ATP-binding protein [uncultured Kriegella sp.]|uniref:tetratricopeptide repeat-containing hybrid sensor histidine kinase/response regulator n=1 Tax=uncultured Kriegella sp. TaxID=1798910 RepID=UPI0030D8927D